MWVWSCWRLGTWAPTELPASVCGAHWEKLCSFSTCGPERSWVISTSKHLPPLAPLPSFPFFRNRSLLFYPIILPSHLDMSRFVTDSCSSQPPPPRARARPSLHPSLAVPRRAGRSRADCTRGLGRVTTPCCLLGSRSLHDVALHFKGKSAPCVWWFVFLPIVTYCLWRHFIQIAGLCDEKWVYARRRLLLLQEPACLFLTFSKRLTIWPDKTGQTLKTHIFPNPSYAGLYSAVKRSSTCETKQLRDWCAALLLSCRASRSLSVNEYLHRRSDVTAPLGIW